jgi:hypothetical protein
LANEILCDLECPLRSELLGEEILEEAWAIAADLEDHVAAIGLEFGSTGHEEDHPAIEAAHDWLQENRICGSIAPEIPHLLDHELVELASEMGLDEHRSVTLAQDKLDIGEELSERDRSRLFRTIVKTDFEERAEVMEHLAKVGPIFSNPQAQADALALKRHGEDSFRKNTSFFRVFARNKSRKKSAALYKKELGKRDWADFRGEATQGVTNLKQKFANWRNRAKKRSPLQTPTPGDSSPTVQPKRADSPKVKKSRSPSSFAQKAAKAALAAVRPGGTSGGAQPAAARSLPQALSPRKSTLTPTAKTAGPLAKKSSNPLLP